MAAAPTKRVSLLRASDFCQSRQTPSCHVKISLLSSFPKRKRSWDADATAFASHDLLVDLSMTQGDVGWLQSSTFGGGIPVVVKIASKDMIESAEGGNATVVFVPPTLAASVGYFSGSVNASLTPYRSEIPKASMVHVREIGRPLCRNILIGSPKSEQNSVRLLQSSCNKRLLTVSMLISVLDPNEDLRFFEVLDIEEVNGNDSTGAGDNVYLVGPGTRWRIGMIDHGGLVPRLPGFCSTGRYYHSMHAESKPNDTVAVRELQLGETHTSLDDTVLALSIPMNVTPAQKVIHIVGTEENHVGTCVAAAADRLGMRCLQVHGLAAFSHAHGDTVSTGSLMDQLSGLQAALEQAQECAPCVVHFHEFQTELSQADEPQRHSQEQRFWSVLMEGLTTKSTPLVNAKRWWMHPVIVVISSAQALSAGPLLQSLVQPSITLQPPNDEYAEHLWDMENYHDAQPHLLGLSAREIVRLKKMWILKCKMNGVATSGDQSMELLGACRQEIDSKKKLVSVKIPDVQWEDVGGLAHVRREIVDAIELPLRHAQLFPHSGRSGILLYGPPGTGKTLVAKAVATECGLPFLSVKGPELLGSYVGESEANVRETFVAARQAASASGNDAAILFFDELDSLAPRRGGLGDGGGVMERVVATLLTELDGRKPSETVARDKKNVVVFVIGATNRPDLLDPSLLRPGRLDRLVYLGQATTTEHRGQILAAVMRKFRLENEQDAMALALQVVDKLPPDLSGADFAAIASGALMRSIRRLCDEAEEEAARNRQQDPISIHNEAKDIEDVLSKWEEDRLVPVVTVDDLIDASKGIVPSVSAEELANFERLRVQFSTS